MKNSVEETLMFVGRGSFGFCEYLVAGLLSNKGADKSCGSSDSRSDILSDVLTWNIWAWLDGSLRPLKDRIDNSNSCWINGGRFNTFSII